MKSMSMNSSFYKILREHDFTPQLRLPPQFVKNHERNLSEKAKLLDESGHSWTVRIEQIGNHHFFTDGWTKFAKHAHLKLWEFLLFKYVGKSTFEVSVYGVSGCQKKSYSCHEQVDHNTRECEYESDIDRTAGIGDGEIWSFVKKLSKHHTSELEIPRYFALDTGIVKNRKVKLQDGKGKRWPTYVTAKKCGKFAMTAGWNEFLTGSNVAVGSTVSFEYVSSSRNIIKAKVLKKGTRGELFSCAKTKGRPPKFQG